MMTLADAVACGTCAARAVLTRKTRRVRIDGRTARVRDAFYRCTKCGEELCLPGMMDAVMKRATMKVHEQDGLLTPGQVREVRKRHGLTQPAFEKLLGVGVNTVVRWERGTVPQNSSADSLLRLVARFPENARFLAELHGVELGGDPHESIGAQH